MPLWWLFALLYSNLFLYSNLSWTCASRSAIFLYF
jgi:hypothetical protein